MFRLLPYLGYCEQCCNEHWGACILLDFVFLLFEGFRKEFISSPSPASIFIIFFKVYFWLYHLACGILVPQPGLKHMHPTVEMQSLNHWATRDNPLSPFSKDHPQSLLHCQVIKVASPWPYPPPAPIVISLFDQNFQECFSAFKDSYDWLGQCR